MLTQDSAEQINSLFVEFFNDQSITVADAQARFVDIIANAD
jgi:glucose/mannose transport system substrate-binding protein